MKATILFIASLFLLGVSAAPVTMPQGDYCGSDTTTDRFSDSFAGSVVQVRDDSAVESEEDADAAYALYPPRG